MPATIPTQGPVNRAPAAQASAGPHQHPTGRDPVVDLIRAACLCVVVVMHTMMAGVTVEDDGLHVFKALQDQSWFVPVSWVVQVMPLFFLAGGVASVTQWQRARSIGAKPGDYVRSRLHRLVFPALVAFLALGAGQCAATLAGAPVETLAEVGRLMGLPLWFLGVYLGTSVLVPVMVRAHEAAPARTMLLLVSAAAAVDLVSATYQVPALGFANLAFVWLAMQQAGFWYADGWFQSRTAAQLRFGAAASIAALLFVTVTGTYSADMLANLNPPNITLLLVGAAQTFLLAAAGPKLRAVSRNRYVRTAVTAIGGRAMTIYLWHIPVLVIISALGLAAGLAWPEPHSVLWWFTRIFWIAAVAAALLPVAGWFGRYE
ncbi:acyltransferase family protein [Arthrobacter castelli]|uniref:acyltransferase family protein n=1 Tax=Arthrobacter castelli TaxID=271431 RepID=UPI00138AAE68|nr:acyltransferase [Arthrobacter castelli]